MTSLIGGAGSAATPSASASASASTSIKSLTVHEFAALKSWPVKVVLVGIVVSKQDDPPPCPPGAFCKPTVPKHVMIADDAKGEDMQVRVYVDKPQFDALTIGQKYRMTAQVKEAGTSSFNVRDVSLLSYSAP